MTKMPRDRATTAPCMPGVDQKTSLRRDMSVITYADALCISDFCETMYLPVTDAGFDEDELATVTVQALAEGATVDVAVFEIGDEGDETSGDAELAVIDADVVVIRLLLLAGIIVFVMSVDGWLFGTAVSCKTQWSKLNNLS